MIEFVKPIFLGTCLIATFFTVSTNAQAPAASSSVIEDVLQLTSQIKTGETRAELERDFELDGGIQMPAQSRYRYKKCVLIKIDVEFSRSATEPRLDFMQEDIVAHVSKPYLEYPDSD